MSRLLLSIILLIASVSCITAQQSVNGLAEGAISISPSTLITPGTTVSLKAEARVGNGSCIITSYIWTFVPGQMPTYERDPPTFTNAQAATTDLNFMTILGNYKMQVMVTDCTGATTSFQFTIRVVDNVARIRASIDNIGQFLHNGNATDVNGFTDGSSLVMSIDNVQPGDIFAIVGTNQPTTGTNPAAIAATITWRGMDFNTDNVTWKCVGTNLSVTTGSNAWMKPGFADGGLPTAVSMGLNTNDTIWYAVNGNKPVQASADAHFIWFNHTLNNLGSDASQAWCRYVFSPPDYLISGTTLVFTPDFFATTPPPTQPPPIAPTLVVPTTIPSDPTTPTTGPTDPNTGLPTDSTPTIPIIPNAGNGNKANTESSSNFPIIYVVIPIVVVAALAIAAFIIYTRRRNNKETSLVRLRGSNAV